MKFSFGVITRGVFEDGADERVDRIIDSIEALNVPEYEIIVVGTSKVKRDRTTVVPFNEEIKPQWITRKKNIITELAKYENVTYSHDYKIYMSDWYEGFLKFGDDFKVCVTKVLTHDDKRWRDWIIWPWNSKLPADLQPPNAAKMDELLRYTDPNDLPPSLIPYDISHLSKYQYVNGSFWVAKKRFMQEYPLDNVRVWGQDEDTEWSFRVRQKHDFKMNPYSTNKIIKPRFVGPNGHSDSYKVSPPHIVEQILKYFPAP